MTWIDFNFFWAYVSTELLPFSNLQDLPPMGQFASISGIPLWLVAWFLWVIFGLGFKDRTLQSPAKNTDEERPAR